MGRLRCWRDPEGLNKGSWTAEEDQKLMAYIQRHGPGNWRSLSKEAGLLRCGKSCRLRWVNYLAPDIKRGKFSDQEEFKIMQLHAVVGNKWSYIAKCLPGRTDNEIKNYWKTRLKKRVIIPINRPSTSDLLHPQESFRVPSAAHGRVDHSSPFALKYLRNSALPFTLQQLIQSLSSTDAGLLAERINSMQSDVAKVLYAYLFTTLQLSNMQRNIESQSILLALMDSSLLRLNEVVIPDHQEILLQNRTGTFGAELSQERMKPAVSSTVCCQKSNSTVEWNNSFNTSAYEGPLLSSSPWPEDQLLALLDNSSNWKSSSGSNTLSSSNQIADGKNPITGGECDPMEFVSDSVKNSDICDQSAMVSTILDALTPPPPATSTWRDLNNEEDGSYRYWRDMLRLVETVENPHIFTESL